MIRTLKLLDGVKIYISHSHSSSDRILVFELANYLKKSLANFRTNATRLESDWKKVDITCDRKVTAEADTWWHEFDKGAVKSANFILLIVSPDYLASDHCKSLIDHVRSREQEGSAAVIPILLRPVEWQPPHSWNPLPRDGRPVADWSDLEAAFADIVEGVLQAIPVEVQKGWVGEDTRPRIGSSGGPFMYDQVHLGLTVPQSVSPGSEFVARFAAYTPNFRELVSRNLMLEAPGARQILDVVRCHWKPGTPVSVVLRSNKCRVTEPRKTFIWDGEWEVLRFDAEVLPDATEGTAILKFDVYIEGFVVASLRPEITVTAKAATGGQSRGFDIPVPRSAFASYSNPDRDQVLGRIRSLQIVADIDVFVDCLSVRPGEEWKNALHTEISRREMFWLFWSRAAIASKFVEWEWHTAYVVKGKSRIQPHPLEPADVAPPPKELEDLQFGSAFEAYLYSLRSKQAPPPPPTPIQE